MSNVSVVTTSATIDSPAVLVFSDILNFNPAQYNTIDEVLSDVNFMLSAVNRASLYSAYVIGKLVDPQLLDKRFGIPSVAALARMMGYSTNTLIRYRTISQMLTPAQVERLATRRVSINAVLELAKCEKDHPREAEAVLDMLLTGSEIKTESDVENAIVCRVLDKLQPHNMAPGAEPEVVEGVLIENNEPSDESVADQFLEASHNPIMDAEDVGDFDDDDEFADTGSAESGSKQSSDNSDGGSLNVKEIKTLLRAVKKWIAAAKRDTVSVHDIEVKLEAILDKDAVILGDTESHEEYFDLVSQLYESLLCGTEAMIREVKRGMDYGYIKRGILLPESATVETLFRKED